MSSGIARGFAPPKTACYACTISRVDWDLLNKRRSCSLLARRAMREGGVPTTPIAAQTKSKAGSDICLICQSSIESQEIRFTCPDCKAQYHQDCWQDNKGCAIYGCPQVPPTDHREDIEIPVS